MHPVWIAGMKRKGKRKLLLSPQNTLSQTICGFLELFLPMVRENGNYKAISWHNLAHLCNFKPVWLSSAEHKIIRP